MDSPRPRSLAIRATLSIISVALVVGGLYLAVGYRLAVQREQGEAQRYLQELLSTVERSASIACFLNDPELAGEVARGLLANSLVAEVTIDAGPDRLAQAARAPGGDAIRLGPVITRRVISPFDRQEVVGDIRLAPDQAAIDDRVAQASYFIGVLMLAQVLVLGLTVTLVVFVLITRPLRRLAVRLRELPAEQGMQLECPRGHEQDEIGELVGYLNRVIGKLLGVVDQERRLRQELAIEERRFRSIFRNAETGIFLADGSGAIRSCNPACLALLRRIDPKIDSGTRLNIQWLFSSDERAKAIIDLCRRNNRSVQQDLRLQRATTDRRGHWIQLTLTPIGRQELQGVINDITERKRNELRALRAAMKDPLTGLFNRMGFVRGLNERIGAGPRDATDNAALLLIDLDRFKQVNDTYGHAAGDAVLIGVANLLKSLVRKSDLVGRLGGDEFVILLTGVDEPNIVRRLAEKIVAGALRPFDIGEGQTAQIGVSVGIALGATESVTREELFRRADLAMYEVKDAGRNGYRIFGEPFSARSQSPGSSSKQAELLASRRLS
jgi:diguanylate cyclase (GGDEF)-like protein